jgi:hypothetical protein
LPQPNAARAAVNKAARANIFFRMLISSSLPRPKEGHMAL